MNAHINYCNPSEYRADIDGIRALAILVVLVNHLNPRLLPGGYVGVDVFFVISGYLITAIIERDLAERRFSFMAFYARRAQRLIPANAAMVISTIVVCYFLFLPKDFQDLGKQAFASAAMLSNVLFWKWNDYFAGQTLSWPLLHTWSLSVEEQFYLVYPPLLWLTAGQRSSWRRRLLAGLLVLSLAASLHQARSDPRSAYYLLPSRAWELLAGSLLAFTPPRRLSPWPAFSAGVVGLACIASSALAYTDRTPFPGLAACIPVCGTLLLIAAGKSDNLITQLLATPPLVAVGRMSYSLYLWHWPVLMIAFYPWMAAPATRPSWVALTAGACTVLVSWLSFYLIEAPVRAMRIPARNALMWAGCSVFTVGLCGLVIHLNDGFPSRLPPDAVRLARGALDFHPRRNETIDLPSRDVVSGHYARLGDESRHSTPSFVLWGDSTADALLPAFDDAARAAGLVGAIFTKGGTLPLVELQVRFNSRLSPDDYTAAAINAIASIRPDTVFLAARWSSYLDPSNEFREGNIFTNDLGIKVQLLRNRLAKTVALLRSVGVRRIVLLREVPAQPFDVPRQLAWNATHRLPQPQSQSRVAHDAETRLADSALADCSGPYVAFVDIYANFFKTPNCLLVDEDGLPLFTDNLHLSTAGARLTRTAVSQLLHTPPTAP